MPLGPHPLTSKLALPQLIWLLACLVKYNFCSKINKRSIFRNSIKFDKKKIFVSYVCKINFKLTLRNEDMVTPISGRRMSPAALVATVTFPCTIFSEMSSCDRAVWFDAGWSKISASSTSCGRIFWDKVFSSMLVWLRTLDTMLSTLRPAVSTSSKPLCRSSFPYKPKYVLKHAFQYPLVIGQRKRRLQWQSSSVFIVWWWNVGGDCTVFRLSERNTKGLREHT